MSHFIAPSVLAADFANLGRDLEMINKSKADWIHVDVMDGSFVPNISFGQDIVKTINKHCDKPIDLHLMVVNPEKYIQEFRDAGADNITVHIEGNAHIHRLVQQIKSTGAQAGVALNPHTSINELENLLEDLDFVVLMSVNPGFGGQKFIYQTIEKIRSLKKMIIERNSPTKIEIDGGVGLQNAAKILEAGADVLVAGSSVFKSDNPIDTIEKLKALPFQ